MSRTIFSVVEDVNLLLLGARETLAHLAHALRLREWSVKKLGDCRLLHNFGSTVADHLTEALVAVDDGSAICQSIGHQKAAIYL